ncbi:L-rhamnose mutarotase [uncultured Maribacter sp.]|uniref:L-rhamnose mutarotase n=1 Tax=uncultured Maribacter sp. TaxID=431308 RepID=UPI0030EC3F2C|tara:strand:- start:47024 stop:47359 length:336 start_codon:yes stop_codon:yes gene_type:complete
MKRHCLTLDLKDDPALIAKYEVYHKNVWPEVLKSLRDSGIMNMEIYRIENRLFMIIEVNEDFSFEKKSEMDVNNSRVQDWEVLMWNYQKALPFAKPGEKWMLMDKIFNFSA